MDEQTLPGTGLRDKVIAALRTVYDPEIPVNIYDLGLVYALEVDDTGGLVKIRMTLTAPFCPMAETFPQIVSDAVGAIDEVTEVELDLVWDPLWSVDRMSEAARLQLGML